jgi:hypothetical protein
MADLPNAVGPCRDGVEFLTDDDYARWSGALARERHAQMYKAFLLQSIASSYGLQDGDLVEDNGRLLRVCRGEAAAGSP